MQGNLGGSSALDYGFCTACCRFYVLSILGGGTGGDVDKEPSCYLLLCLIYYS